MPLTCDLCETPIQPKIVAGATFWLCPNDNEGRAELPDGTHYLGWIRGEGDNLTLWNNCPGCDSPICFAPPSTSQVCSTCLECPHCCECKEQA